MCWLLISGACLAQSTPAVSVILRRPSALAVGADGSFYIAERNRHVVDRVDASGALTVVAGSGTAGFAGDGGLATAAMLDSPEGIAVDAAGDLYISDTRNHRVRRVDASTGLIKTVVGDGTAGSTGDGAMASVAELHLPAGLLLDSAGDLYICDRGDHRVRRVDAVSGLITTVAGTGVQGSAGDGGLATAAQLDGPAAATLDASGRLLIADKHQTRIRIVDRSSGVISLEAMEAAAGSLILPQGVSVDASGALIVAEAGGQRIRAVSPSGAVSAVAGGGAQGFAGDGAAATAASLNAPAALAASSAGLLLVDRGNDRVRVIAADGTILTVAGGGSQASGLTLNASGAQVYGQTVVVVRGGGSGTVMLEDAATAGASGMPASPSVVATALPLAAPETSIALNRLSAGKHNIYAAYSGDGTQPSALIGPLALTVAPAVATYTANPAAMLYGQVVPALTGTVSGILPFDTAQTSATFSSDVTTMTSPGIYAITAALNGGVAGNYSLSAALGSGSLTVAKAPSVVAMTLLAVADPTAPQIAVKVASTTSGVPSGTVRFLDGQTVLGQAGVDATGAASFTASGLAAGSHTLAAYYLGDQNFLPVVSSGTLWSVGAAPDFSISAASASSTQTVKGGSAASFVFNAGWVNGMLDSPVALSVTGLPTGYTSSFSPAYLPPGGTVSSFTLAVQTVANVARIEPSRRPGGAGYGILAASGLLLLGIFRRRPAVGLLALLALAGCGDRLNLGTATKTSRTVLLTVIGAATERGGIVVQHSAVVTLIVN